MFRTVLPDLNYKKESLKDNVPQNVSQKDLAKIIDAIKENPRITIFWLLFLLMKKVLSKIDVGVNVGVNDKEKIILDMLLNDPTLTASKISLIIKKSKRTIERYFKTLQKKVI